MGQDPNAIRHDIQQTRQDLGHTIDELGDRLSPRRVVQRRKARLRDRFDSLQRRVMGSDAGGSAQRAYYSSLEQRDRLSSAPQQAQSAASSAKESVQSGMQSAAETARSGVATLERGMHEAPQQAREQAEGNPIAAGIVAFGAGLLAASMFPATKPEQKAGSSMKEHAQPLKGEAKKMADEVKSDLQSTAKHAAEEVKSTAQHAAQEVKHEAQTSAQEVKSDAQSHAQQVREEASGSAQSVKEHAKESGEQVRRDTSS